MKDRLTVGEGVEVIDDDLKGQEAVDRKAIRAMLFEGEETPHKEKKQEEPTKKQEEPAKKADAAKPAPKDEGLPNVPEALLSDKKEEAPKTEDTDAKEVDQLKLNEKQKAAFISARMELRSLKARLSEAAAKPASAAGTEEVAERIKALEKERNDLMDRLAQVDLAHDPRFVAKYRGPADRIREEAARILKELELPANLFSVAKAASSVRDRLRILEPAGELKPILLSKLEDHDAIEARATAELSQARRAAAELAADKAAAVEHNKGEVFAEQLREIKTRHVLFTPVDGDEKWNENVAGLSQSAKELLMSDDAGKITRAVILGVAAPVYEALWKASAKQVRKLSEDLRKITGAAPKLGGDGVDPGIEKPKKPNAATLDLEAEISAIVDRAKREAGEQ